MGPTLSRSLPVLSRLALNYTPSARRRLLLVTHVLGTAVDFVEILRAHFDLGVVAIPYSVDISASRRIRENLGIEVLIPQSLDQIAPIALSWVSRQDTSDVIVQEIGGYLADSFDALARVRRFLGIVEDTSNGHWRYVQHAGMLKYPVVSIARSPIKAIEDSRVGHAVTFSLERVFRETYQDTLTGKHVLVVGFGRIGRSCAQDLKNRGCRVSVTDRNPVKDLQAAVEGFEVLRRRDDASSVDIVLGATGSCSITDELLARLSPGTVVVSASSRQIECDVDFVKRATVATPLSPNVVRYQSERLWVDLVNDGYPVNFLDESVLGHVLDAVYAELFVCVREIAERRAPCGLSDSWDELHCEVATAWASAQGRAHDDERFPAPTMCKVVVPKHHREGSRASA